MQNLYLETSSLDRRCYDTFKLSEEVLMEHAADGMADYIRANFEKKSSIFIACGAGNNGADGIVLARLLHADYEVILFIPFGAKSAMGQLQYERAEAINCNINNTIDTLERYDFSQCDVIVDALFGSGLSRAFDENTVKIMKRLNSAKSHKIACDVPSGVKAEGSCEAESFCADVTFTMGALKRNMYLDASKNVVGDVKVLDLGVSRTLYEVPTQYHLLDSSDLVLPTRSLHDSHKGSYGHLAVLSGNKLGASVIAAQAALAFGSGLVTLISEKDQQIPHDIMQSPKLPKNSSAIALGMGLGVDFCTMTLENLLDNSLAIIVDADMFSHVMITKLLSRENCVMTPHPKEFVQLLKVTQLADISVAELQAYRFKYVTLFHEKYPNITLLLKGANVLIASKKNYYVNPHGTSALAKGGSGDVLSGLIGALLAQGYTAHDATIHASLAHALALKKSSKNSYAMSPFDIIEGVSRL